MNGSILSRNGKNGLLPVLESESEDEGEFDPFGVSGLLLPGGLCGLF